MFYLRMSVLFGAVSYLLMFAVRNNVTVAMNMPFIGIFNNVHITVLVLVAILIGMTLQYLISLFTSKKKK